MRVQLFSIFDRKTKCFLAPFVARTETDAVRQITQSLRDPQMRETPVGQHPADFNLARVGAFDDETGQIEGLTPAHMVCSLDELAPAAPSSTVPS